MVRIIALMLVIPLFIIQSVKAHGTGLALQKTAGGYAIDVHYPYPFKAEQAIWLNFFLTDQNTGNPAGFTDIDISLVKNGEAMLKTNINKKTGIATGAVVTFPREGSYMLYVTYNDKNMKLAEASFPIAVAAAANTNKEILGIEINKELGAGALGGILLSYLFAKYRAFLSKNETLLEI